MESVMLELNEGHAWDQSVIFFSALHDTPDILTVSYVHSLTEVLATCILLWDHLITLDSEIQHIWMRPKSRSSIIFLAFRYYTLASVISVQMIFAFCPLDEKVLWWFIVCHAQMLILCRGNDADILYPDQSGLTVILGCSLQHVLFLDLLLTLRVYALYSADRRIVWLFVAATLTLGGLTGFALTGQDKIHHPIQKGCHVGISHQTSLRIVGVWMALFAYDAIIFGLTASRTYQFWREVQSNQLPVRRSLLSLFFRDGTIYFAESCQYTNILFVRPVYERRPIFICQLYFGDNAMPTRIKSPYDGQHWVIYQAEYSDLGS
uniref:DUF6533 domain-containing protein n=1 Tax=Moniliophthora roreri TaxID=221103 RepID=A0A0W0FSX7_MONRR